MSMDARRFREHSGDESIGLSVSNPDGLRVLEKLDTLLMYEEIVKAPHAEWVRFGRLRDIRVEPGSTISFRFTESGRIQRSTVLMLRHRLQIEGWEPNRTHWAVKDGRIPQDVIREVVETSREYDVVLSYAGEDRAYPGLFIRGESRRLVA